MSSGARSIDAISDSYIEKYAELDPAGANEFGIPVDATAMPDYSPKGAAEEAGLRQGILAELSTLRPQTKRDQIATDVMKERLSAEEAMYQAGEWVRDLNNLGSPLQGIHGIFDLMPGETAADWANIVARAEKVPDALNGMRQTLQIGLDNGTPAARRQAVAAAQQALTWGGAKAVRNAFRTVMKDRYLQAGISDPALEARLDAALASATNAFRTTGAWLRDSYAPAATRRDGVGADRYALNAALYLGVDSLDVLATHQWGWDEYRRNLAAIADLLGREWPGKTLGEVVDQLNRDPHNVKRGAKALQAWLKQDAQDTMGRLDQYFTIPQKMRTVEANLAPPGGAAAMYCTPPSEDFKRPGASWYPVNGRTVFPTWSEQTTGRHELVPGHHMQVAKAMLATGLTRFQRTLAWNSGYGEGWALYAERFSDEEGLLSGPEYVLGYLFASTFRAQRVIVDTGLHLDLRIPTDSDFHPGEKWTPRLAEEFMTTYSGRDRAFTRSEVIRYLGLPAQAITYKVGEREWLGAREDDRRLEGKAFTLKRFHDKGLDLGPVGLDLLRREFATPPAPSADNGLAA